MAEYLHGHYCLRMGSPIRLRKGPRARFLRSMWFLALEPSAKPTIAATSADAGVNYGTARAWVSREPDMKAAVDHIQAPLEKDDGDEGWLQPYATLTDEHKALIERTTGWERLWDAFERQASGVLVAWPALLEQIPPATRRDAEEIFGPEMRDVRDPDSELRQILAENRAKAHAESAR
jgi:hypothetical protein